MMTQAKDSKVVCDYFLLQNINVSKVILELFQGLFYDNQQSTHLYFDFETGLRM